MELNTLVRKLFPLLMMYPKKWLQALYISVENEYINDDSKIIISNVLPSVNFHHTAYSPNQKSVTSSIS
jgi:hypothetical protein